jgi:hypothetical protein
MNPTENPRYKGEIHRIKNTPYEKCLWHTMTCTGVPIKAHAIQNSRALASLAENGHVVMFAPELRGADFDVPFKRIGRNLATTFTGLCSEHDTLLFRPIDTNEIDPANPEHRFLVAYRAVLKGLHAAAGSARMVQLSFQKGVELGQLAEDGPEMMLATTQIIASMYMFEFAQCFHQAYVAGAWDQVRYETLMVPTPAPAIAASGVCLPTEAGPAPKRQDRPFLAFSIFPQNGQLFVEFAWLPEADAIMRRATKDIVAATEDHQLYLLSKFILKYTETFTLKPSVYETFTKPQAGAITEYFLANAAGNRAEWDDPRLYLFGPRS